jgi:23S rRNA (uracil1939-C5)-methyltransferase
MSKTKVEKRKQDQGDDKHKSATQLRNERKRRAAKKAKPSIDGNTAGKKVLLDPSMMYISKPTKAPIVRKAVQFFREQTGEDFLVIVGPTRGWRTVSKLAVRLTQRDKKLTIGLFQPKTHDIIPGSGSATVHHPSINAAVHQIQSTARSCQIAAYNETTGQGDFRNVAINVERSTGKVQVTIIWKGESKDKEQHHKAHAFATRLVADMTDQLHSLWIHFNASWKHDNAIISHTGSWERVYGPEDVVEYLTPLQAKADKSGSTALPRIPLHFPPFVFRQANLDAFTSIVCRIREKVASAQKKLIGVKRCVELYGGVGTIGLSVADLFVILTSSDENPHNKACFDKSLEGLPQLYYNKDCRSFASYESANAETMVANGCLDEADCVIVDPPRKGLDQSVVDGLCSSPSPCLLVYVSCGFDAFVRDYHILVQKGGWKLMHAEGHILFPGSDAIETIAFFER